MPPQQYLLNFRIAKACELLTETLCTIGEISRSVGYQDLTLFADVQEGERLFAKRIP